MLELLPPGNPDGCNEPNSPWVSLMSSETGRPGKKTSSVHSCQGRRKGAVSWLSTAVKAMQNCIGRCTSTHLSAKACFQIKEKKPTTQKQHVYCGLSQEGFRFRGKCGLQGDVKTWWYLGPQGLVITHRRKFLPLSVFSTVERTVWYKQFEQFGSLTFWPTCVPQTLVESLPRIMHQALFRRVDRGLQGGRKVTWWCR